MSTAVRTSEHFKDKRTKIWFGKCHWKNVKLCTNHGSAPLRPSLQKQSAVGRLLSWQLGAAVPFGSTRCSHGCHSHWGAPASDQTRWGIQGWARPPTDSLGSVVLWRPGQDVLSAAFRQSSWLLSPLSSVRSVPWSQHLPRPLHTHTPASSSSITDSWPKKLHCTYNSILVSASQRP